MSVHNLKMLQNDLRTECIFLRMVWENRLIWGNVEVEIFVGWYKGDKKFYQKNGMLSFYLNFLCITNPIIDTGPFSE